MALSSMGHSQASAQSLQSIACVETERKISFVIHEPENVSGGSNVTVCISDTMCRKYGHATTTICYIGDINFSRCSGQIFLLKRQKVNTELTWSTFLQRPNVARVLCVGTSNGN